MFLLSPASYLSLDALKADSSLDLTDRAGNPLTDDTLTGWLQEESGAIDALIKTSFLPQEQKLRYYGDGSNFLNLYVRPLIYIKQVKILLPNAVGFDVPVQSLLVDFQNGNLDNMTPLTYQGIGIETLFPKNLPIDVTVAWGLGYAVPPPTFVASAAGDTSGAPFAAGEWDIAVSSVTYSGESMIGAIQTVTLSEPGALSVLITNASGAMRYYVYACEHGTNDFQWYAETQGFAIGAGTISAFFDQTPPTDVVAFNPDGSRKAPSATDTSAAPFLGKYAAILKCVKLGIQARVWEEKNPSNLGIYRQQSGRKSISFKDNVHSTFQKLLDDLVDALSEQAIY